MPTPASRARTVRRSPPTAAPSSARATRQPAGNDRRVDHREVVRGHEQHPRRVGGAVVAPGQRRASFGRRGRATPRVASANRSKSGSDPLPPSSPPGVVSTRPTSGRPLDRRSFEEQRVDHAEGDGVDAHADGQGQHGGRRKHGVSPQLPEWSRRSWKRSAIQSDDELPGDDVPDLAIDAAHISGRDRTALYRRPGEFCEHWKTNSFLLTSCEGVTR